MIVLDDGSTDRSNAIASYFAAPVPDRIIVLRTPKHGPAHARNHGLSRSKGKYLEFLDADDVLLPDKVLRHVQVLEESGADIVFGPWQYLREPDAGTRYLAEISDPRSVDSLALAIMEGWWAPPGAMMFTRDIITR